MLTDEKRLMQLSASVNSSIERWNCRLIAFVFMPEHVHLLVTILGAEGTISSLLKAIKRPFSYRIKQQLVETNAPLLKELTVRERPGKTAFRFWQEGPGYDRNLQHERSVRAAIDYIHLNPVRRGLCDQATDWKWSSARWYLKEQLTEPDLPTIHGLPAEFFIDTKPD